MTFATLNVQKFTGNVLENTKSIKQTGKYVGVFKKAVAIVAKNGTKGIGFSFEATDGKTAWITLYIEKVDGKRCFGYDILNEIMACLGLQEISDPKLMPSTRYNAITRKEVACHEPLLLELSNRPIGIILQNCEYENQDGKTRWQLDLRGAFHPVSNLTGREIITHETEPKMLENMMTWLKDRPLKKKIDEFSSFITAEKEPSLVLNDDIPF